MSFRFHELDQERVAFPTHSTELNGAYTVGPGNQVPAQDNEGPKKKESITTQFAFNSLGFLLAVSFIHRFRGFIADSSWSFVADAAFIVIFDRLRMIQVCLVA